LHPPQFLYLSILRDPGNQEASSQKNSGIESRQDLTSEMPKQLKNLQNSFERTSSLSNNARQAAVKRGVKIRSMAFWRFGWAFQRQRLEMDVISC